MTNLEQNVGVTARRSRAETLDAATFSPEAKHRGIAIGSAELLAQGCQSVAALMESLPCSASKVSLSPVVSLGILFNS